MMAHFAEVDPSWNVLRVIVVNNEDILDENNVEQESLGVAFCKNLFGEDSRWLQTSYNNNFRKNYAGPGSLYDPGRDAFLPPQPYPSWTIDEDTCLWEPPTPAPTEGQFIWDEGSISWIEN
jgi:hypothetical protein|tara:strand:- start:198 stop:560 length:363 start_codon:yes stop_codon:yes gene_type:complete